MPSLTRSAAALTFIVFIGGAATASPRNWVDRYISANGHCAQQLPADPHEPLGKPIEEWSNEDLSDLKAALDRCDAMPEDQTFVSHTWTGMIYDKIAGYVHAKQVASSQQDEARMFAQEQAARMDATRRRKAAIAQQEAAARLDALKQEADREATERQSSEDRTAAIAIEQKAAVRLAEETEARARAVTAEAQARHGVEAAKQRAYEAEAVAQNADQKAANDRSIADERFKQAHPQVAPAQNGSYGVGSKMSCSDVADIFDNDDKENAVKIGITIDSLMKEADARQIANGNPSVLRVLTEAAYEKIKVLPVSYCRNNRGYTLKKATLDIFDGVKGMQNGFR